MTALACDGVMAFYLSIVYIDFSYFLNRHVCHGNNNCTLKSLKAYYLVAVLLDLFECTGKSNYKGCDTAFIV